MNINILQIKFPRLAVLLLPIILRQPAICALLSVLVSPFSELLTMLTKFRYTTLEQLKYNGQVCRLEYCLNSLFTDQTGNEHIRVVDGQQQTGQPFYIYPRGSAQHIEMPMPRGTDDKHIILNYRENNAEKYYDFFVIVPQTLSINQTRLKAVINNYKTPGKSFKIILS